VRGHNGLDLFLVSLNRTPALITKPQFSSSVQNSAPAKAALIGIFRMILISENTASTLSAGSIA
jgi:hypothetical protein